MAVFDNPRIGNVGNGVGVIYPGNAPSGKPIAANYTYYRSGAEVFTNPSGFIFYDNLNGRYLSENWSSDDTPYIKTGDYATAASGVDATIYLPSETNRSHVIYGVSFSYSNSPANGVLQMQSPSGTVVYSEDITSAGAGFFPFENGLKFPKGSDVRIILTNGNSSKKVSLMGRRTE